MLAMYLNDFFGWIQFKEESLCLEQVFYRLANDGFDAVEL